MQLVFAFVCSPSGIVELIRLICAGWIFLASCSSVNFRADCKVDGDMNSCEHACHDPFCELGA